MAEFEVIPEEEAPPSKIKRSSTGPTPIAVNKEDVDKNERHITYHSDKPAKTERHVYYHSAPKPKKPKIEYFKPSKLSRVGNNSGSKGAKVVVTLSMIYTAGIIMFSKNWIQTLANAVSHASNG